MQQVDPDQPWPPHLLHAPAQLLVVFVDGGGGATANNESSPRLQEAHCHQHRMLYIALRCHSASSRAPKGY
jgi:hypothetical protein